MKTKRTILFPKYQKIFGIIGENIRLARKRRKLTTAQVAERARITRSTLYLIEKGSHRVCIGSYFNVLLVFNLHEDFLKLAANDEQGRVLQDLTLLK